MAAEKPLGKVDPLSLPFDEAIEHFKGKVRFPTEKWTDIWQGAHTRAFVVAGATEEQLLVDLQSAVLKGLEQGTTLEQFRKDFDQIVSKRGWEYRGGRDWRSRVIFETNIATSYQAGRYQQMKELAAERPYWEYRHGDSINPRPEHQAWNGLVLRADDPWWDTHYPPNGWGCKCTVVALTREEAVPDEPPPVEMVDRNSRDVTDEQRAKIPEFVKEWPKDLDPEWAYNVGRAALGGVVRGPPLDGDEQRWEPAPGNTSTWQEEALSQSLPADEPKTPLGKHAGNARELQQNVEEVLGGKQATFAVPFAGLTQVLVVDAESLARHIAKDMTRSDYVTRIPELLKDPAEIWANFVRDKVTGKVALRVHFLKRFDDTRGPGMLMAARVAGGHLVNVTFFNREHGTFNAQRKGKLVFKREK